MKKYMAFVLVLACVLGLIACQKTVNGSDVYSFPEPTAQITGIFYSQGQETVFEIGAEDYDPNDLSTTAIIKWFHGLKLIACDEPDAVEGAECYSFYVRGESSFIYQDRGSEAYVIIKENYCKVCNPSVPPIN